MSVRVTKPPSPVVRPAVTLGSPTQIREAKRILREAGYSVGQLDGQRSPAFVQALRTFQKAWGLPDTGKLDDKTLARLRHTSAEQKSHGDRFLTTGMKGEAVKAAEARLKKLGYNVGKVDGIYSRSTFEAAKAFKATRPAIKSKSGSLGAQALEALKAAAKSDAVTPGGKGKNANVRAITFNWPSRYKKGGEAADEAMFDRLSKQADVMGFPEFGWGHTKITDKEKNWSFYNPDPKGDGDKGRAGQVLAWNNQKFKLVEKGTSLLNPKTRIQKQAAGPTMHRGKSVIWAKLKHRETGEIWKVAVVHFVPSKHLGGAAEKLWMRQRDELAKWMAKQGPRTLVMGDFNGQWNDRIARPLHKVANAQSAPSHGRRAIDWILRSKDLKGVSQRGLDNAGQSDHRPVQGIVRG